jgi:hypothetical protein
MHAVGPGAEPRSLAVLVERSMTETKRKRLFIDQRVQGAIIKRMVVYWLACMLFVTIPLLICRTLAEPERLLISQLGPVWKLYWPILATGTLLLPLLIFDALKVTNRFAGPLFRLRRNLQRFAEGKDVGPTRFRETDFWPDLAEQIDQLIERVRRAESRISEDAVTDEVGTELVAVTGDCGSKS